MNNQEEGLVPQVKPDDLAKGLDEIAARLQKGIDSEETMKITKHTASLGYGGQLTACTLCGNTPKAANHNA